MKSHDFSPDATIGEIENMTTLSKYIDVPEYTRFGEGLEYVPIENLKDKMITITAVRFYTKTYDEDEPQDKCFFTFTSDEGAFYTNTGSRAIVSKLKAVAEVIGYDEDKSSLPDLELEVTVKRRLSKINKHGYMDIF